MNKRGEFIAPAEFTVCIEINQAIAYIGFGSETDNALLAQQSLGHGEVGDDEAIHANVEIR